MWTPAIGDTEETADAKAVTSVVNFTASRLHDGLKMTCAALYIRLSVSGDLLYERSVTLRVFCEFLSVVSLFCRVQLELCADWTDVFSFHMILQQFANVAAPLKTLIIELECINVTILLLMITCV